MSSKKNVWGSNNAYRRVDGGDDLIFDNFQRKNTAVDLT